MLLLEFNGFHEHREKHEGFFREVKEQSRYFSELKKASSCGFINYLKEWVSTHIVSCDTLFAEYFFSMKQKGKLEEILSREPENFFSTVHQSNNYI